MLGVIIGDILGSPYEYLESRPDHPADFASGATITDDSLLACAIAEAALSDSDYRAALVRWYDSYPGADWGMRFIEWAEAKGVGVGTSAGNGAAVRAVPLGWLYRSLDEVLHQATLATSPSHNCAEALLAAQAVAGMVWMLRNGSSKGDVERWVEEDLGIEVSGPFAPVAIDHPLRETCAHTLPSAIRAFLDADGFEDAITRAIRTTRDADSAAAITGALSEAHWGVPPALRSQVLGYLDDRILELVRWVEGAVPR